MRPAVKWLVIAAAFVGLLAYVVVGRRSFPPSPSEGDKPLPAAAGPSGAGDSLALGQQLYGNYCLQCHGEKGNGEGPAAVFLYPKPRDFGEAKFRLVTTANRMPSDRDLMQVIEHGMPGSAMFSFGHLADNERKALIAYVRQLAEDLIVDRRKAAARDSNELDELRSDVHGFLQPGKDIDVSALPANEPDSVARGKKLFEGVGCASCHGLTGKGDGVQEQKDDRGIPTQPRDFTLGIFKGGRSERELYARVVLGMPGTPMPGSSQLKPQEIGDMINFILSLSPAEAATKVKHQRMTVSASRFAGTLADNVPESAWTSAVLIVVSPLWWRVHTPPNLQIQALHDGQNLAVRMTWLDATRNESALRPEDFEDMAAVQLFKGSPEPFLGMGAGNAQPELWLWRAGWQPDAAAEREHLLDDYPFEMPIYRELTKGKPSPDFRTARAAGNLITHSDHSQSASSLAAKGFGSTTFRPKASQKVTAKAEWKDGRWTVVMRRPMQIETADGIPVGAGGTYSVAFALWDGSARDRNGQKMVSIWHDLTLE